MRKTFRVMIASVLIGAAAMASAAEDFSQSFNTASGSAFTQYFSVTADAVDSLYLSIVGSSAQYDALSFEIAASVPIKVDATLGSFGKLGASFDDFTNNAYSLNAGQAYTLVVTGVTKTLADGVSGVVTISGLDGNVASFAHVVVPAVPEPETYAMLLAGLGVLTVAVRRRASVKA